LSLALNNTFRTFIALYSLVVLKVQLNNHFLQAQSLSSQAEKRGRAFDKTIDEWKRRVADLQAEVENSQRESRSNAAEVYKLRTQMEEQNDAMEGIRRENKNLSGNGRVISTSSAAYQLKESEIILIFIQQIKLGFVYLTIHKQDIMCALSNLDYLPVLYDETMGKVG